MKSLMLYRKSIAICYSSFVCMCLAGQPAAFADDLKETSIPSPVRLLQSDKWKIVSPGSPAESDFIARFEQFRPDVLESKTLTDLWNKRPHTSTHAVVTIQLQLEPDGSIATYAKPFVYQSSGSRELDEYAINCLREASPFNISPIIKTIFKRHGNLCLAVMDTDNKPRNAYLKTKYESNYYLFAEALQNKIRPQWKNFRSRQSYKVECQFVSTKDGGIENAEVIQSSGDKKIDQACLATITGAMTLTNIVPGAPDRLSTRVVFEYDSSGKEYTSEVWVDNTLRSEEKDFYVEQSKENQILRLKTSDIRFIQRKDQDFRSGLDDQAYMALVAARIKKYWLAARPNEKYTVVCRFKIGTQGQLLRREIIKSGGSTAIDNACLKAIVNATPFGPPPKSWNSGVVIDFNFEHTDTFGTHGFMGMPGVATSYMVRPQIDQTPEYMAPYLVQLKNAIENKWQRDPDFDKFTEEESVVIDINKNGSVKNFRLKIVTGKNSQDRAIIEAVKAAQPFAPLPKEAGESYSATIKFAPKALSQQQLRNPSTEKQSGQTSK